MNLIYKVSYFYPRIYLLTKAIVTKDLKENCFRYLTLRNNFITLKILMINIIFRILDNYYQVQGAVARSITPASPL
ncbi:hypothetical protein fsci_03500 [Francisella sciaenopsi]|uniref:Uncharacterized protein n=1 Tax=Francisella sciaenopsi TaxID=3055034 RepID=A0ABQ6PDL4_9GAMM